MTKRRSRPFFPAPVGSHIGVAQAAMILALYEDPVMTEHDLVEAARAVRAPCREAHVYTVEGLHALIARGMVALHAPNKRRHLARYALVDEVWDSYDFGALLAAFKAATAPGVAA